jgi:hypothetical protein
LHPYSQDGSGDEEEDARRGKRKSAKEKKAESFAAHVQKKDYNNSCFRAIKRALFGEVRWSQVAYFPVVKYKLAEEDLDCNRGEITIRVLRSNRGKVLRGLDSGIRNMSLGETAQVKVRYDRAYSSFTLGTFIPPRANIVFTCELLTINGKGKWGMPARQLKRIYRFFFRIKEACVNKVQRVYWNAKKRYNGVLTITKPPDSYYMQDEEEESLATSADSWGGYHEDKDDDEDKVTPGMAGVHLGAKIMWGFQPEKRPVMKKKVKTEYERLLERQRFLSEKKSVKALQRKQQRLLMAQESADRMGLGDDEQLQSLSQSLEGSSLRSLGGPGTGEGSLASSGRNAHADLDQNVITDDMAITEMRSNDGGQGEGGGEGGGDPTVGRLKLDLDHVVGDDGSGSTKSTKSKKDNNKSKKEQKDKKMSRRASSASYLIR